MIQQLFPSFNHLLKDKKNILKLETYSCLNVKKVEVFANKTLAPQKNQNTQH